MFIGRRCNTTFKHASTVKKIYSCAVWYVNKYVSTCIGIEITTDRPTDKAMYYINRTSEKETYLAIGWAKQKAGILTAKFEIHEGRSEYRSTFLLGEKA